MRLLLFSDLHRDEAIARRLIEQSQQVEMVVGAGDFATCRRGLPEIIGLLSSITCPTVLVPGNAESFDELQQACRDWPAAHVLHGSGVKIDGVEFFGLGGAVPLTPFGPWSFDLTEEDAQGLLETCPPGVVLVTHSPPFDIVDTATRGRQLGSRAIRRTIEQTNPRLVVCGHIHESAGRIEYLGQTPIINAGPSGRVWTLA